MALHRDFLMRMIENLAAAFFRILAGRQSEDPEQALLEIEDLLGEALGTTRDFALGQGPAAIDTIEPALAAELARLLLLHARIADEHGQPDRAGRARQMGVRALERALERPGTAFARLAAGQLREHLAQIADCTEPARLAAASMAAHRVAVEHRDWAAAEDWIFFALDADPNDAHITDARSFFQRLAQLPESELEAGGLTLDEVAESAGALDQYEDQYVT